MIDNVTIIMENSDTIGAVEQWKEGLNTIPETAPYRQKLHNANIHDPRDRMEIEEIIEHEVRNDDVYLMLHDAFDDLKRTFDW